MSGGLTGQLLLYIEQSVIVNAIVPALTRSQHTGVASEHVTMRLAK